jgi:hypothetical protein
MYLVRNKVRCGLEGLLENALKMLLAVGLEAAQAAGAPFGLPCAKLSCMLGGLC